jgi:DNA polymerase-3 subunit epsilon
MFVALDVETANGRYSSICQIGLVLFEGGKPVEEWQTLIDPQVTFAPGNIGIHGIHPSDVRGAPTFAQAAGEVFARIDGQIVVAHNAKFDRSCISHAAAKAGLALPWCRWLCSVQVARRAWHGEVERFGLARMAEHLDLTFRHHDALEDARTCGQVVCAASRRTGLSTEDWMDRVKQPLEAPHKPRALPPPQPGTLSRKAMGLR